MDKHDSDNKAVTGWPGAVGTPVGSSPWGRCRQSQKDFTKEVAPSSVLLKE